MIRMSAVRTARGPQVITAEVLNPAGTVLHGSNKGWFTAGLQEDGGAGVGVQVATRAS